MLDVEKDLWILNSMIDNLRMLSVSEEVADTMTGSALYGIAETMNDHLKKIQNSFEEVYKNDNF